MSEIFYRKPKVLQSKQQPSCYTLMNQIELLNDPDFQKILQSDDQLEMVKQCPIVGQGLEINQKKKNGQTKYSVKGISKIEKIIDTSAFNNPRRKEKANCIIPLFEKEGNEELLNCELYKRKLSYLLTNDYTIYVEDAYLILMEITLKFIFKVYDHSSWQLEILSEAFTTCEQVFIPTNYYVSDLNSLAFKQTKYKILNLFCLYNQNKIQNEQIVSQIIPQMIVKSQLNEHSESLSQFFDSLQVAEVSVIFQNIDGYIQKYLDQNSYFCLEIFGKKTLKGMLQYMKRIEFVKQNIDISVFFPQQSDQYEEYYQLPEKELIQFYFTAKVHNILLDFIICNYNTNYEVQLFKSIQTVIDNNAYYQKFLQNHKKCENLMNYYSLRHSGEEKLIIKQIVAFYKKQIILQNLVKEKLENEEVFTQYLMNFFMQNNLTSKGKNLLQILNENSLNNCQLHVEIEKIVVFVTWINYSFVRTNLKNEQEIKSFLRLLVSKLQSPQYKNNYSMIYDANLNEFPSFCFNLYHSTSRFQLKKLLYIEQQNQLENLIPKFQDSSKREYCKRIFHLCKNLG